MAPVKVDLDAVELKSCISPLRCKITSAFWIDGAGIKEPTTAEDLCQGFEEGHLWVSRAGSCRLDFALTLHGAFEGPFVGLEHEFFKMIAQCPIWDDLQLTLKPTVPVLQPVMSTTDAVRARASFLLYREVLASTLMPPPSVQFIEFHSLDCLMEVILPIRVPATSPSQTTTSSSQEILTSTHPYMLRDRRNGRLRSRRLDKTKESSTWEAGSAPHLAKQPSQQNPSTRWRDHEACIASLTDVALHKIIGLRRLCGSVRNIKGLSCPPLLKIAPPIWNMPYLKEVLLGLANIQLILMMLQAMEYNVRHHQSISSTLARFTHKAQSPGLRKAMGLLVKDSDTSLFKPGIDTDKLAKKAIESRLWTNAQTRLHTDPIDRKRKRPGAADQAPGADSLMPSSSRESRIDEQDNNNGLLENTAAFRAHYGNSGMWDEDDIIIWEKDPDKIYTHLDHADTGEHLEHTPLSSNHSSQHDPRGMLTPTIYPGVEKAVQSGDSHHYRSGPVLETVFGPDDTGRLFVVRENDTGHEYRYHVDGREVIQPDLSAYLREQSDGYQT